MCVCVCVCVCGCLYFWMLVLDWEIVRLFKFGFRRANNGFLLFLFIKIGFWCVESQLVSKMFLGGGKCFSGLWSVGVILL